MRQQIHLKPYKVLNLTAISTQYYVFKALIQRYKKLNVLLKATPLQIRSTSVQLFLGTKVEFDFNVLATHDDMNRHQHLKMETSIQLSKENPNYLVYYQGGFKINGHYFKF